MPVVLVTVAEVAVSSLAVANTVASNHCAYPRRDGQAGLTSMVGFSYPSTHPKFPILTKPDVA